MTPRYRGGILRAPSSRIVSPFSIGFSTMWRARAANSAGSAEPVGEGDLGAELVARLLGQRRQQRGVEVPGAIVTTRTPRLARSRAAGQREADDPAL